LRAESDLVETGLTVRDRDGRTVAGLHASDFEVLDNGVPQQITTFSEVRSDSQPTTAPPAKTDPHEPKYITFFIDDYHNGYFDMPYVKAAARGFIAKGLKAWDMLSIATASGEGGLDFTNDAKLFAERFEGLRSHNNAQTQAQYDTQTFTMADSLNAAAKKLSEMRGKRIMLLVSYGFSPATSRHKFEDFADAALRANITVQAIHARLLDSTSAAADPRAFDNARQLQSTLLQEMAERTGGHFFKDSNDFTAVLDNAINPEVTYLLAFRPGTPDGKFHTLKIKFKSSRGDSLDYRPGYLSRKDDSETKLSARRAMDDAVFSQRILEDVAATVTLAGGQPKDGVIPVSVGIAVDVGRLQFASSHGRHMQQIVFLMTLLDAKGDFVTGKESIMDLALTDEKLAALKKDGLKTVATLNAPPGIYQVRTVVREGMKGNLAASTTTVELRGK
jgi:VWFA-related protein